MTVAAKIPSIEHTGNGSITAFTWDWPMLPESNIFVRLNDTPFTDWTLVGNSVIFDTAPTGTVLIYRVTDVWMPEDYVAFGRFAADKSELSVDRAIMIAQEIAGDRGNGNAAQGALRKADLLVIANEFYIDLISVRGDDAEIPMWNPDGVIAPPPTGDPTIVWAGDDIFAGTFSLAGNSTGVEAVISFGLDGLATWDNFNNPISELWVDVAPSNNEYWMRVTEIEPTQPNFIISDGEFLRASGEAFLIHDAGPEISAHTFGDTNPSTRQSFITVEIAKDDSGVPGAWVERNVSLEAIWSEVPPESGDLLDGLISWWELSELSGDRLDSHGSNTLSPVKAPSGVSGHVGNCMDIGDGTNADPAYLKAATTGLDTDDFTISAWVNKGSSVGNILGKATAPQNANLEYRINCKPEISFYLGTSTGEEVLDSGVDIEPNKWMLVIISHVLSTKTMSITVYREGFGEIASVSQTYAGTRNSLTAPFMIGQATEGLWGTGWNAKVDEVAYWDRVLTAGEDAQLYNSGNGLAYPAAPDPIPPPAHDDKLDFSDEINSQYLGAIL